MSRGPVFDSRHAQSTLPFVVSTRTWRVWVTCLVQLIRCCTDRHVPRCCKHEWIHLVIIHKLVPRLLTFDDDIDVSLRSPDIAFGRHTRSCLSNMHKRKRSLRVFIAVPLMQFYHFQIPSTRLATCMHNTHIE